MLSIVFLIFFSLSAYTQTYFIDCDESIASDLNDGVSTSSPWRTVNKVSTFGSFSPGKKFLFKRGCTWYGDQFLLHNIHGEAGNEIEIGAYGEGEQPIFSHIQSLRTADWQRHSTNVWYTDLPDPTFVMQVFLNWNQIKVARAPQGDNDWFFIRDPSGHSSSVYFEDAFNDAVGANDITDADIIIRATHWSLYVSTVQWYDSQSRSLGMYGTSDIDDIKKDYGFFIANKIWMMGENTFVFDKNSYRLYVYFPDDNPANHEVTYVKKQERTGNGLSGVVEIGGCSYLRFSDITVENSGDRGIVIDGESSYVYVTDCTIRWTRLGISFIGWAEMSEIYIENNDIQNCWESGIYIWSGGENTLVHDCEIRGNFISDVGTNGGLTGALFWEDQTVLGTFYALSCGGTGNTVADNTVRNSIYCGIHVIGFDHIIEYNFIENIGGVLDDCGLIYTWGGGGFQVRNNLGIHGIPAPYGTPTQRNDDGYLPTNGLYSDDRSESVVFEDNTMIDVFYGVQHHNNKHGRTRNNIFFDTYGESCLTQEDHGGCPGCMVDMEIEYNIFHSRARQGCHKIINQCYNQGWNGIYSKLDNNLYYAPDYATEWFDIYAPDVHSGIFGSLQEWKSFTGLDHSSGILGDSIVVNTRRATHPDNFILNGASTFNIDGWTHWPPDYFVLEHTDYWGGQLKTSYAPGKAKEANNLMAVYDHPFLLIRDQTYVIKFTFTADADDTLYSTLRQAENPNAEIFGANLHNVFKDQRMDFELGYTHEGDNIEVRLDFGSGLSSQSVLIDDVMVYPQSPADDPIPDPDPDPDPTDVPKFCIIYNKQLEDKVFQFESAYCDQYGNEIFSVTLEKRQGFVLLNCKYLPECPRVEMMKAWDTGVIENSGIIMKVSVFFCLLLVILITIF